MGVKEHLDANAGAGAWINDFISSTNPRFNNKSKSERRKMAIGAYMAAKAKGMKEEFEIEEGYDKTSAMHKAAKQAAQGFDGKAIYHPNGHAEVRMRAMVHGHSTVNPHGTVLMSGEEKAKRAAKEHGGKAEGSIVHFKEGTLQGNVAGGDAMNTTTSAPSDNKMPAGSVKKVKGFKFFNGTNEPNTQMAVKEETLDERNKANALMRKTMDASRGARYKLNNPVPAAEPEHKTAQAHNKAIGRALRNEGTIETSTGRVHKKDEWEGYPSTFKDKDDNKLLKGNERSRMNKAIPPNDKLKEAATGNPGNGYHGAVQSPDEKYEATHKHVKNLTDADDKTVKHYLDSAHGRHLAGREEDHEYIKKDFKKFKKYYRPEMHESTEMARLDLQTIINNVNRVKPMVDKETDLPDWIESKITMAADYIKCVSDYIEAAEQIGTGLEEETAPVGKVQKIDKKTAVIKLHPNGAASDTDEGWAKPKIKEGTMKSYKDFLQGLDEASKKKPAWLLDAELNAEKKEGKLKEAKEGSAEDKKEDKAGMKRTGMTAKEWEKSAEDKKEDMQEANWIKGAIKHPGAMTAAAKRAGETNAEYEQQHKHDSGKAGRRARLALTLKKMHEEQINEYEADKNGVYRHTKKATYGTSYVDPEGADETAADLKKKEKKTAGRKAGSGAGVYKPRATMSKLKQLGATYK